MVHLGVRTDRFQGTCVCPYSFLTHDTKEDRMSTDQERKPTLPEFQTKIQSGPGKRNPGEEVSYIDFENFYAEWPKDETGDAVDKATEAYMAYCMSIEQDQTRSLPEFREKIQSGPGKRDPEEEVSYIQLENMYAEWPKEGTEDEIDKAAEEYMAYCEGKNECAL